MLGQEMTARDSLAWRRRRDHLVYAIFAFVCHCSPMDHHHRNPRCTQSSTLALPKLFFSAVGDASRAR